MTNPPIFVQKGNNCTQYRHGRKEKGMKERAVTVIFPPSRSNNNFGFVKR